MPTNCRTRWMQRLGEIETALAAFEDRPVIYRSGRHRPRRRLRQHRRRRQLCRSIAATSGRRTRRPCVEPEQDGEADGDGRRATAPNPPRPRFSAPSSPSAASAEPEEDEDDDAVKPLPGPAGERADRLSHAGAARCVANNPHVAMTALLHKLCLDAFQHSVVGRLPRSVGAAGLLPGPGRRT